ncbi:MAG: hypothetical protein MUF21_08400 [Gemmatimonadaceae bacterium]|jgi:hypothetical protein|nr:hypothetical protein [Gemmatimonadaceae bacterium]
MRIPFYLGVLLIVGWAVFLVISGFPDGLHHGIAALGLVLITWDWVTQRGNPIDRNDPAGDKPLRERAERMRDPVGAPRYGDPLAPRA